MSKDPFSESILEWVSDAQQWASERAAEKTRQVFYKIVDFSPEFPVARYSKGHFIHNWQAGRFPSLGEKEGTASRAAKKLEIGKIIDDEFFLTNSAAFLSNNTEYAWQVEELGWFEQGQSTPAYSPVAKGIAASLE